jgi:small subunit ribosomal protein S8e
LFCAERLSKSQDLTDIYFYSKFHWVKRLIATRKIFKASFLSNSMKTGRKITGGKYKKTRKKKLFERKSQARVVKLGEKKTKILRTKGGNKKHISLFQNTINLISNGKSKKALIKNVTETPSNRFLARQNVLTKGAIIETELVKAIITNRPSQEGIVQGKLLPSK